MRSLEGARKGPENWVLKNLSISFISTYLNIWTNLNIRIILTLITQTQDNSLAEEYCAKIILAPLRCTVWVKWSIEHLTSLHPEIHPFKIHLSTKYSCLFFPSKKKMFLGSPCCRAAAGEAPGWLLAKRAPFIANLGHFGPMKGPPNDYFWRRKWCQTIALPWMCSAFIQPWSNLDLCSTTIFALRAPTST